MRTEERHPRGGALESLEPRDLARLMADETRAAADAVEAAAPALADAVLLLARAFRDGGCVIYVGSGTSGRIGVMDAAEMRPTFGVEPSRFLGLIAGSALVQSVEGAEDDEPRAAADLRSILALLPAGPHVVVGISASGSTPYVLAAIREAAALGLDTIGIANNAGAPLLQLASVPILLDTGPELLAGSTRLKAATAQKVALNTLSLGAMCLCGRVSHGAMTHMLPTNRKLRIRAVNLLMHELGLTPAEAELRLVQSHGSLEQALQLRSE